MIEAPIYEFPVLEGGGYYPETPNPDSGGGGGIIINPPAIPPSNGTGGNVTGADVNGFAISPNTPQSVALGAQKCFTVSSYGSVPSEDQRYADFNPESVNGCQVYNTEGWLGRYVKKCGVQGTYDARVVVQEPIYKFQPANIQGTIFYFTHVNSGSYKNHSTLLGLQTVGGNGYDFSWEITKYCYSAGNSCTAKWYRTVRIKYPNGTVSNISTTQATAGENFRVRTDGTKIFWEIRSGYNWIAYHTFSIPTDTGDFQFFADAKFLENNIQDIFTIRGAFQGQIGAIWSTPDGGTLTGTGNTRCFSHNIPGTYRVCVTSVTGEQICVPVTVEPLYFRPIGLDCGECVFAGQRVQFESNATGVLTADKGTVINPLLWRAPDTI